MTPVPAIATCVIFSTGNPVADFGADSLLLAGITDVSQVISDVMFF